MGTGPVAESQASSGVVVWAVKESEPELSILMSWEVFWVALSEVFFIDVSLLLQIKTD